MSQCECENCKSDPENAVGSGDQNDNVVQQEPEIVVPATIEAVLETTATAALNLVLPYGFVLSTEAIIASTNKINRNLRLLELAIASRVVSNHVIEELKK